MSMWLWISVRSNPFMEMRISCGSRPNVTHRIPSGNLAIVSENSVLLAQ